MNDPSHPSQRPDSPRPASLPGPRASGGPRTKAEDAAEQVSLDEMMARLRQSSEGGGSGRRRRRSVQDKDTSSKSPAPRRKPSITFEDAPVVRAPGSRKKWWILGGLFGLFLIAGGVVIGIRMLNRWRVEGDGFKVNLGRRVSELMDRRVSFSRFRQAADSHLGASSMTIAPVHQDLLESAVFNDLMAQLTPGSWMSGDWSVVNVRAREINLAFQPGKVLDTTTMWQTAPAPVDRGASGGSGFRLGISSDPTTVLLETGNFEKLNLSWPGPGGKPESLNHLEGNFRLADNTLNLEMAHGELDTAAWPPFPVQQMNVRLKGTRMEIVSARVALGPDSVARLSGNADLVPDGKIELTADIPPVLLASLLPTLWGDRVAGQFETSQAKWVSHFKTGPPAEFSGPFRGRGMVLKGLPFVDKIANLLRKPQLTLMEFLDFKGTFSWTPERTRLSGLTAQSQDGLLKLSGEVEVTPGDNVVTGKLRVEASDVYFTGLADGPPVGFAPSEEGWMAMEFELSGREGVVLDTIPGARPSVIERAMGNDSNSLPKMTLPPQKTPSAPERPAAAPVRPVPAVSSPVPAPPVRPQKSNAELEQEFNKLLGR